MMSSHRASRVVTREVRCKLEELTRPRGQHMGQGSVVLEVSEDMKSGVDGPGDMRQQLREGIRAYSKPITVCHHMFFIQKR